jgi:hypothetical protein
MRLISINSVLYSPSNPAVDNCANIAASPDPASQFAQLVDELTACRSPPSGDQARPFVFGHIGPMLGYFGHASQNWCLDYTRRLERILTDHVAPGRSSGSGSGSGGLSPHLVFGHQHESGLRFLPAAAKDVPAFLQFLVSAVSPVYLNNPNFRVMYFDADASSALVDWETYYLNLTASNIPAVEPPGGDPWQLEYYASGAFGIGAWNDAPSFEAKLTDTFFPPNVPAGGPPSQALLDLCRFRDASSPLRSPAKQCCAQCPTTIKCLMKIDDLGAFDACING